MTNLSYAALREKAAKEGGSTDELLPAGEGYFGEIVKAGAKAKAAGYSLWWHVKLLVGPDAGKTGFLNQQLNPENGKQLDIFFRVCKDLGIDFDVIPDGTPPEAIAKLALGRKIRFDIVHNPSKTDATKIFANFVNISLVEGDEVETPDEPEAPEVPTDEPSEADLLRAQLAALEAKQAEAPAAAPKAAKSKLPF